MPAAAGPVASVGEVITAVGCTAEQLDATMAQDGALPWGTSEEHDRGFCGDAGRPRVRPGRF